MKSKVNDFALHGGDDSKGIGKPKSFVKKAHYPNDAKKKEFFISSDAETTLISDCEIVLRRVISKNILYNRRNKDAFITEWSVPIQIAFNQSLDYDFVVDWS